LLLCRLAVIIEIGIDLIIDAPKIWKYLADLLGKYLRLAPSGLSPIPQNFPQESDTLLRREMCPALEYVEQE